MTEKEQRPTGDDEPVGRPTATVLAPSVPSTDDGWPERLAAQLAARQRRRANRAEIRAAMAAARAAGLARRHAAKLSRTDEPWASG